MKNIFAEPIRRFALRKLAIGLVSLSLGMVGLTSLSLSHPVSVLAEAKEAGEVSLSYHYVLEEELSLEDRALIQAGLPERLETGDRVYWVYRPSQRVSKFLPKTGEEAFLMPALLAGGLLLPLLVPRLPSKKRLGLGFLLIGTGLGLTSPDTLADMTGQLSHLNHSVILAADRSAQPKELDGYDYVGYVLKRTSSLVSLDNSSAPVTKVDGSSSNQVFEEVGTGEEKSVPKDFPTVTLPELEVTETFESLVEELPYAVEYVSDSSLPLGEERILQSGQNGYRDDTYRVIKLEGEEVSRDLVDSKEFPPTPQLIAQGSLETSVPEDFPTVMLPELEVTETLESLVEELPYTVEYVADSSIPLGEERILQSGQNGHRDDTYRVIKLEGEEVSRDLVDSKEFSPTPQLIAQGNLETSIPEDFPTVTLPELEATSRQETVVTVLPLELRYEDNPNLLLGTEEVLDEGEAGQRLDEVSIFSVDGHEVDRHQVSSRLLPGRPRVIARGTGILEEQVTKIEQVLPFETEIILDDQLPLGQEEMVREGLEGLLLITRRQSTLNGQAIGQPVESQEVLREPVNRLIRQGQQVITYVERELVEELPVPEEVERREDKDLYRGEERFEAGRPGQVRVRYRDTYVNQVLTETQVLDRQILQESQAPIHYLGSKDVIVRREELKRIALAYDEEELLDPTLPKGQIRIEEGQEGEAEVTYEIISTNGKDSEPKEISRRIIREPQAKKVYKGSQELGNWTSYRTEDGKEHQILWASGITPPVMGADGDFKKVVFGNFVDYQAPFVQGQGWYDSNKRAVSDESIDATLCFAAVATNMLYWWLDQNQADVTKYLAYLEEKGAFDQIEAGSFRDLRYLLGEDGKPFDSRIYQLFVHYFFDKANGYQSDLLVDFILNGYKPKPFGGINIEEHFEADPRAGFFHQVFGKQKLTNRFFSGSFENFDRAIKTALTNQQVVGLEHLSGARTSHIITLWGAEYDEQNQLLAVYVTDSDDQHEAKALGMKRYLVRSVDGRVKVSTNETNPRAGVLVEYLHTLSLGKEAWQAFWQDQK